MQYNPYDQVQLIINGKPIYGRPTAFDSDVVDYKEMKNAFGKYVKPTQVVSTCPDCGQGFTLNIRLYGPPFDAYDCTCPICKKPPAPIPDPFINPISSGRITLNELDPMLHNISIPIDIPNSTVADRLKKSDKKPKTKKTKKQSQTKQPIDERPSLDGFIEHEVKLHKLESAQGMEGDEQDLFDDGDMVES